MFLTFFSRLGVFFLKMISRLPLRWLYKLSGLLYFIVYFIIRYRRDVVFTNLKNSFPEKDDAGITAVAKEYYRHLCDTMLESLVRFGRAGNDLKNIVDLSEAKKLDKYFEEGVSILMLSFHYGNWEFGKFLAAVTKHKNFQVYNPQRNRIYDSYINGLRSEYGGIPVPTKRIYRKLVECRSKNEVTLTILIADQTPLQNSKFWTIFLNQETPFFPGPGRLSTRIKNQPLLLYYFEKTGRGRYKLIIEPLVDNPSGYSENEILKIYALKIESIIKKTPQYYLWSHRRWKHKRPEGVPLQ